MAQFDSMFKSNMRWDEKQPKLVRISTSQSWRWRCDTVTENNACVSTLHQGKDSRNPEVPCISAAEGTTARGWKQSQEQERETRLSSSISSEWYEDDKKSGAEDVWKDKDSTSHHLKVNREKLFINCQCGEKVGMKITAAFSLNPDVDLDYTNSTASAVPVMNPEKSITIMPSILSLLPGDQDVELNLKDVIRKGKRSLQQTASSTVVEEYASIITSDRTYGTEFTARDGHAQEHKNSWLSVPRTEGTLGLGRGRGRSHENVTTCKFIESRREFNASYDTVNGTERSGTQFTKVHPHHQRGDFRPPVEYRRTDREPDVVWSYKPRQQRLFDSTNMVLPVLSYGDQYPVWVPIQTPHSTKTQSNWHPGLFKSKGCFTERHMNERQDSSNWRTEFHKAESTCYDHSKRGLQQLPGNSDSCRMDRDSDYGLVSQFTQPRKPNTFLTDDEDCILTDVTLPEMPSKKSQEGRTIYEPKQAKIMKLASNIRNKKVLPRGNSCVSFAPLPSATTELSFVQDPLFDSLQSAVPLGTPALSKTAQEKQDGPGFKKEKLVATASRAINFKDSVYFRAVCESFNQSEKLIQRLPNYSMPLNSESDIKVMNMEGNGRSVLRKRHEEPNKPSNHSTAQPCSDNVDVLPWVRPCGARFDGECTKQWKNGSTALPLTSRYEETKFSLSVISNQVSPVEKTREGQRKPVPECRRREKPNPRVMHPVAKEQMRNHKVARKSTFPSRMKSSFDTRFKTNPHSNGKEYSPKRRNEVVHLCCPSSEPQPLKALDSVTMAMSSVRRTREESGAMQHNFSHTDSSIFSNVYGRRATSRELLENNGKKRGTSETKMSKSVKYF